MTDSVVADLGNISCLNTITGTLLFVLLFSEINLRTCRRLKVSKASYLVINAAKQTSGPDTLHPACHPLSFKVSICRKYKLITKHLRGVFLYLPASSADSLLLDS
jgi:hypothetical protein